MSPEEIKARLARHDNEIADGLEVLRTPLMRYMNGVGTAAELNAAKKTWDEMRQRISDVEGVGFLVVMANLGIIGFPLNEMGGDTTGQKISDKMKN